MNIDPVAIHSQKTRRLLQFIKEKGKDGAKLREIWVNLTDGEERLPPACIINEIDRLKTDGKVVEVKEYKSQGYLRRFYDASFIPESSV